MAKPSYRKSNLHPTLKGENLSPTTQRLRNTPPSCVQRIRCVLNGKTLTWNNEVCGEFLGVMSEVKMTTFLTITKVAWKYPEGQKQPHHIFQ